MVRAMLAAVAAVFVGGAAAQSVVIPGASSDEVRAKLVRGFTKDNWQLENETPSMVVFSKELTGGDQMKWRLLLGNSRSTPARAEARFVIVKTDDGVQVSETIAATLQMASGQLKRQDVTAQEHGGMQNTLNRLRDTFVTAD